MTSLNVAIVGLIGITRKGKLLLRSTTGRQKVGKEKIPKHCPRISFRQGGAVKEVELQGEEVSFELTSSHRFKISNEKIFLDFSDLLRAGGSNASVSPLCKTGECEELAGHVLLSFGTLCPGEAWVKDHVLYLNVDIDKFTTEVTDRYRPTKDVTKSDFVMPKVATGALLKVNLTAVDVRVKVGSNTYDIETGPVDGSRRIEGAQPADFTIWIENGPGAHPPEPEPPPSKKPDLHFYLFYDFFHEADIERWVPVVEGRPFLPPGSQCITPIMP